MKKLKYQRENLTGDVPQHPRDYLVTLLGSQNAFHDGQNIVGSPGEYEDQQDGGQSLGRLPLPLRLQTHVLLLLGSATVPPSGHGAPVKVQHL